VKKVTLDEREAAAAAPEGASMRETQATRLLRFLRANPGSSSLEITDALRLPNVTGRVSDLREAGYVVLCIRDREGVARYRLVERPAQLTLTGAEEVVTA